MIELGLPGRRDADLVATALLVAAGHVAYHRLTVEERHRCTQIAAEIRDGLAAVGR